MPTTITPYLTCRNAAEAYEFYQKAFGAEPIGLMLTPDGKVLHGGLSIDGYHVYLSEENPEWQSWGPEKLGGTPVSIHLQVDDCDAVFNRAVEAGCTVSMPLELMFWGDKFGSLHDPYGHIWTVGMTVEQKTPEEMQAAADEMFAKHGESA